MPFACKTQHAPVYMGVADAAAGVIFVGTTRVSRSPSLLLLLLLLLVVVLLVLLLLLLLLHAAVVAVVMLLSTAAGVVSVAFEAIFSLVVLFQAQRHTKLVIMTLFVMVDVRVPLRAPCVLSLLLLLLSATDILSLLLLLVLLL